MYNYCHHDSYNNSRYLLYRVSGLDGVEKKLECPPPGHSSEGSTGPTLPRSLTEALQCLNEDKDLVQQLGPEMVHNFTYIKQDKEIKHFENNTSEDMSKADVIAQERKYYMPYI